MALHEDGAAHAKVFHDLDDEAEDAEDEEAAEEENEGVVEEASSEAGRVAQEHGRLPYVEGEEQARAEECSEERHRLHREDDLVAVGIVRVVGADPFEGTLRAGGVTCNVKGTPGQSRPMTSSPEEAGADSGRDSSPTPRREPPKIGLR